MKKKEGTQKGFTLIELMIVVAIIGILASIAIPNFLKARDKAMFTRCVSAMSGLKVAQEMHISDKGKYAGVGSGEYEEDGGFGNLAMYMMPGCTDETGTGDECALRSRIETNCAGDDANLSITSDGFYYEITGYAKDRHGAGICMSPSGYTPSDYAKVTPDKSDYTGDCEYIGQEGY